MHKHGQRRLHCTGQWGWEMPLSEHVPCVAPEFKMAEPVEQRMYIQFCVHNLREHNFLFKALQFAPHSEQNPDMKGPLAAARPQALPTWLTQLSPHRLLRSPNHQTHFSPRPFLPSSARNALSKPCSPQTSARPRPQPQVSAPKFQSASPISLVTDAAQPAHSGRKRWVHGLLGSTHGSLLTTCRESGKCRAQGLVRV